MMKMIMMAGLAASPLPAAAGPSRDRPAQQLGLEDAQAPEPRVGGASEYPEAGSARQDEPRKKGKSTSDKVLTGAAVVLGVGALAVGGLLIAIFAG